MNKQTITPLSVLALALLTPALGSAEDYCKFEKILDAEVDAGKRLEINAGSGSLEIVGDANVDQVSVTGQACASSQKLLDQIELRADSGDVGEVESMLPNSNGGWNWGKRYASLNLTVTVPSQLALEVNDGSGSISVDNSGALVLTDGSGSIVLSGINGDVELRDGSGSITIREVDGTVEISEDGSGSIDIAQVSGDVRIGNDGSGSIAIKRVEGSVDIGSDGSGSIEVDQIAGNFSVGRDGSGGINFRNVDGDLDIPRDKRRNVLK